MNELTEHKAQAVSVAGPDFSPRSLQEAMQLSEMLSKSDLVPKDYQGKPGNIIVAIQWGAEIGLKPLQAMQNIAVINGRPSLWGDALPALARGSGVCEYINETDDGHTATCRVKRRGQPEEVRTFSMDDAKKAGLAGKSGPWTTNPKRMRQLRARAFAIRDVFADILKGMPVAEEVQDYDETATPELTPLGAPRPDVNEWIDRANEAQSEQDLAEVWQSGAAAFVAAKDKDGHSKFKARVQERRAEFAKPVMSAEAQEFAGAIDAAEAAQ